MHEAMSLLAQEHQVLRDLCAELHDLLRQRAGADALHKSTTKLRDTLLAHMGLEDEMFYPNARMLAGHVQQAQDIAMEEHRTIRLLLDQLRGPVFKLRGRWMVLMELIGRHLRREERDIMPAVQRSMDPAQAEELATALQWMQKTLAERYPSVEARPDDPPAWAEAELADRARKRSVPLADHRLHL